MLNNLFSTIFLQHLYSSHKVH